MPAFTPPESGVDFEGLLKETLELVLELADGRKRLTILSGQPVAL